jgi:hypothetical protein
MEALFVLLLEVLGGALEAQVVVASQNQNVFRGLPAVGTAHRGQRMLVY